MHNPLYWGEGESFRSQREEVPEKDTFGQVEMVKRPRPRPDDAKLPRVPVRPPKDVPEYAPIISKEQAMRVLAHIESRRNHRESARLKNPQDFLLTGGLIRCAVCGGSMSAWHREGRRDSYLCWAGRDHSKGDERRHYLAVNAEAAHTYAISSLLTTLLNEEEAAAAVWRLAENKSEIESDKLVAKHQLEEARAEVDGYQRMSKRLTGEEMDRFIEQFRAAEKRVRTLEQKLETLSTADRVAERLIDRLHHAIAGVRTRMVREGKETTIDFLDPRRDREELREYFFALGASVRVHPANAKTSGHRWMDWRINPFGEEYQGSVPLMTEDGYHNLQSPSTNESRQRPAISLVASSAASPRGSESKRASSSAGDLR